MNAAALLVAMVMTSTEPGYDSVCTLEYVNRSTTSSEKCVVCHDGSVGPAIALHAAGARTAHPVGVSYYAAGAEAAVWQSGPRNALVVLPRGRVECVTCHSADGSGPHETVTSFAALCTACHDK
ncbi:MAG TPA: cytochrome c3 family protein [Anaeromyxobacter sp.]